MNIGNSVDWKQFRLGSTGSGSISIDGQILKSSVTIGSNSSFASREIVTQPGEEYNITFVARRISGENGSCARAFIDYPAPGNLIDYVEIRSNDWMEYELNFTVPIVATNNSRMQIGFGHYTGLSGEAEFLYPRISVKNTPHGVLRTVGHGLIHWDGATASVVGTHAAGGIESVTPSSGNTEILVKTSPMESFQGYARPLVFCQIAPNGPPNLLPRAGSFSQSNGHFVVKFVDVNSGQYVDISGKEIYLNFSAFI